MSRDPLVFLVPATAAAIAVCCVSTRPHVRSVAPVVDGLYRRGDIYEVKQSQPPDAVLLPDGGMLAVVPMPSSDRAGYDALMYLFWACGDQNAQGVVRGTLPPDTGQRIHVRGRLGGSTSVPPDHAHAATEFFIDDWYIETPFVVLECPRGTRLDFYGTFNEAKCINDREDVSDADAVTAPARREIVHMEQLVCHAAADVANHNLAGHFRRTGAPEGDAPWAE